jgi:hypothetical protein
VSRGAHLPVTSPARTYFPRASAAGLLLAGALAATGCNTWYAYVNVPLHGEHLAPDCRASLDLTQPRGEKDVLVILCLSGGGSRAAWFSGAAMLRLEQVVDRINLLREVDVISSVSGASLTAAYYCVTRDPGPYSVVRVQQLPATLPQELTPVMKLDRRRGLLGISVQMSAEQRDLLRPLFALPHDRECVERLYYLSHHTHAPEVWQADKVQAVLTRNYINKLLEASFSPLNFWDDMLYWTTGFDRTDQLAKIFMWNLYGASFVQFPEPVQSTAQMELQGYLDRPAAAAPAGASPEGDEQALRRPREPDVQSPVRLDWIPGYSPAPQTAQVVASGLFSAGVRAVTTPFQPFVPYRFKDLNPERPYLILNATSATEDDPQGLRFGEVFTFTRDDFARRLNSSIDDYDVAHAVAASAAFPGAFNYATMRDFRPATADNPKNDPRYLHVFDGGTADNMGLISAKRVILANRDRYRHFVVLMVDAHVPATGASHSDPDPRDRVIDMNFLSSFETLLDTVRQQGLAEFNTHVLNGQDFGDKLTFWHITFDDLRDPGLRAKAYHIPTSFQISPKEVEVVQQCVNDFVRPDHPKLQEFLKVLQVQPDAPVLPPASGPAASSVSSSGS